MRNPRRVAAVIASALFLLAAGKAPTDANMNVSARLLTGMVEGSATAENEGRTTPDVPASEAVRQVASLGDFSGVRGLHAALSLAPDRISPIDEVSTPYPVAPDIGPVLPEKETLAALVEGVKDLPRFKLDTDTHCLATTVYFESKGEPLKGQLAVAQVVLNRVSQGRFGADVCAVVRAPKQFSFVKGGELPTPRKGPAWDTARAIALIAATDSWKDVAGGAKYFHATRVSPGWGMERVASIGNHVFYR